MAGVKQLGNSKSLVKAKDGGLEKQVVSRSRVAQHGEVLTRKQEVGALLDLVKQETERIDSRFLEPACGTGNFLVEVLERKLSTVKSRYRKNQLEYERNSVLAVSSVYGIDILEDNIVECRHRLLKIFNTIYTNLYNDKIKLKCIDTVKYILKTNIINGDALTLKTVGEHKMPIIFSEWSFPFNDSKIKRRDFMFIDLIDGYALNGNENIEDHILSDNGNFVSIPNEVESFQLVHFLKVGEVYEAKL